MKDAHRVDVMGALGLALDVAYHDGTPRDLAVAAEAWTLAGYHDDSIDVSHACERGENAHSVTMERVAAARKGRPKKLLRADARGMLATVVLLAEAGLLTYANTSEATRQRWLARGGHDR